MKPLRKQPIPPSGVVKLAGRTDAPYLMVLFLDGFPYAEVEARTEKAFKAAYEDWRRVNLAQLDPAKVDARFFVREPAGLYEFKP